MFGEFRAFLTGSNALALAIGVIVGSALGSVVTSLVKDIIMPPIGYVLGGVDFTSLIIELKKPVNGDAATQVAIRWGNFVQVVIVFVVVVFVVFWIGRLLIREAPAAPTEPSDEVRLLTEIRDSLRKG